MKKGLILFICSIIFMCIPLNGYAAGESAKLQQQQKALLETAYAYFRQGEQVQYDSYRKNLYATPEDATPQHTVYTVCSGFTFETYYQTFGIELPDDTEKLLNYAQKIYNSPNRDSIPTKVLYYYGTSDEVYSNNVLGTKSKANYEKFSREMVGKIQPGDIFVVTRTCHVN